eukprot:CAMPEP_0176343400 /NCGR_PEP_ID=MMETSP0126-20121128/3914_1 /TAXON_ID=141414 ORGANISM="Strombidinopsis acuminatum, Strain SPMC142" /NCGR_SAMPLE_ID=MMETSP0126 /ASSEMBLY_ACC=CAM_ASM_000229 /LENGTH=144 /DNA_ID=CAMNT_0017689327 /DNA_START=708 /DNA_END=1142 /DNA_ORIENTATION=+
MPAELDHKVDAHIDIDYHGNMSVRPSKKAQKENPELYKPKEGGIQGSGTYVLRNGQLVPGEAEKREEATYSNWYCSNADPEDIRKHRELMDRMHYRGPEWHDKPLPRSVIEEVNPTYRKVEAEAHPSAMKDAKEGKKEFEYVVR